MTRNETFMNMSYYVEYQPPSMHLSIVIAFLVLYLFVILFGIGGNVFVCHTIVAMKKTTVTHFFMANLAGSDILMGATCIPFTVLSNLVFHSWPFGAVLCPIVGFLQVVSVLQRAFTLVTITVDQHRVVWHPLRKRLNKKTARILVLSVWFVAITASLPILIYARVQQLPRGDEMISVCMESWDTSEHRYIYSIVIMIMQYFFPLGIMIVCYSHIGLIVWLKKVPGEIDANQDRRQSKNKRKTLQMLITVATAYALSWLPLHTLTLVGDSYPDVYNLPYMDILWMSFHWLAFSSTGINPVIYCRSNSVFKNKFVLLFCRNIKGVKNNGDLKSIGSRMSDYTTLSRKSRHNQSFSVV